MSLSLSHWYPGSGMVLDSIYSDLCTLLTFICLVYFVQPFIVFAASICDNIRIYHDSESGGDTCA